MFYESAFYQNISSWIFTLNKDCNLRDFNHESKHSKTYGVIDEYDDFVKIHVTKQFIDDILQNGNNIEKFKLLKFLKKHPDIVKNIDIGRKLLNIQ